MAAELIYDVSGLDPTKPMMDHKFIYDRLPQRGEFEVLDTILHLDREQQIGVAYFKCDTDRWWAKGHIPGTPILPGVVQLEAAAQLTAFISRYVDGFDEFIAFGGVNDCRFRQAVLPPAEYFMIAKIQEDRPKRVRSLCQGVVNGRLVFESQVTGMLARQ